MAFKRPQEHDSLTPDWTGHGATHVMSGPPQQLREGRFRLERVLGSGGMGEVHLAEDTTLHRKVAIKSVRADLCEDAEVRKRIERECLLHAKVGPHTNIVTLYDRFEEDGQIRLVMEYVDGETLHARLRPESGAHHSLPLDEAARIAVQVLDALSRIHAHGIVHRDIKPSNIILCKDDRGDTCAKLMDFGIARQTQDAGLSNITQTSYGSPGTPLYMAPEQIDAKQFGVVSQSTDVYAMGVVLYQMVSGEPPFTGTITEIFNAHLNSRPRFVFPATRPVPDMFADILMKALAKRPAQRYASAQAFRDDLQSLLTDAMLGEAAQDVRSLLHATPPAPHRSPRTLPTSTPLPERARPGYLGPATSQRRFAKNRRHSGLVISLAVVLAVLGAWVPIGMYLWSRNGDEPATQAETTSAAPREDVAAAPAEPIPASDDLESPPPMDATEAPTETVPSVDVPEPQAIETVPEAEATEPQPPVIDGTATIASPPPPPVVEDAAPVDPPPSSPVIVEEPLAPLRTETVRMGEEPAVTGPAPVSVEDYLNARRKPEADAPAPAAAVRRPAERAVTSVPLPPPTPPPARVEPIDLDPAPRVEEPPADREPVRVEEAKPVDPPSAPELGFRIVGSESYRKN